MTSDAGGFLDGLQGNEIVGWASYGPNDSRSPQIQVLVDDQIAANLIGSIQRPGVKSKGFHPTGACGFSFSLDLIPEPLRHKARCIRVNLIQENEEPIELRNSPSAVMWETNLRIPAVKKLFFMHIAKAAGTSANHMMANFYSPLTCLTHVETQFHDWPKGYAEQFDFVSGHIEAPVARALGLKNFVWATLFRRPRPHLFSHINWLRHIGSDPNSEFHLAHSKPIRDLSIQLANVAAGDEDALKQALDYQNPTVRTLFDNRQTRYLLPRNTKTVDEEGLAIALERLSWFDLVGTVEQIEVFEKRLPQLLGTHKPAETPALNRAPATAALNFEDYSVDAVLPFIRFDREIYNTVGHRVRHHAGLQENKRKHTLARQPKPKHELIPRLSSLDELKTNSRQQACATLVPANDSENRTLIVLGVSRGGTSMLAGLLKLCGVFMGEKLSPGSHEDVEFHSSNIAQLKQLIGKRNQEHTCWGWKYPHTLDYLSKIETQLRNPHYIVVYRDLASVAHAFHRHDGTDMKQALRDAHRRYNKLNRFAMRCKEPLLTVSYEKAVANPETLMSGLTEFCGLELSMQQKANCLQFINPGHYVPIDNPNQ